MKGKCSKAPSKMTGSFSSGTSPQISVSRRDEDHRDKARTAARTAKSRRQHGERKVPAARGHDHNRPVCLPNNGAERRREAHSPKGFAVLAPDFASRYGGTPAEPGPAHEVVSMTSWDEWLADTRAAFNWLTKQPHSNGKVEYGFTMCID